MKNAAQRFEHPWNVESRLAVKLLRQQVSEHKDQRVAARFEGVQLTWDMACFIMGTTSGLMEELYNQLGPVELKAVCRIHCHLAQALGMGKQEYVYHDGKVYFGLSGEICKVPVDVGAASDGGVARPGGRQ